MMKPKYHNSHKVNLEHPKILILHLLKINHFDKIKSYHQGQRLVVTGELQYLRCMFVFGCENKKVNVEVYVKNPLSTRENQCPNMQIDNYSNLTNDTKNIIELIKFHNFRIEKREVEKLLIKAPLLP